MFNIIFQYSTIHITRYNSNKKRNKLIFVDDMIADMLTNKKFYNENPKKQDIQLISFNHSSGIDFRKLMNLY